jgi:hypothetical protein
MVLLKMSESILTITSAHEAAAEAALGTAEHMVTLFCSFKCYRYFLKNRVLQKLV